MRKSADALVLMAKESVPGAVKTRLAPPLSAQQAAELNRCLLLDLLEDVASFTVVDRYIAFTPESGASWFGDIAPSGFECFPQRGNDLGERMAAIFAKLFASDYKRIVVVGSDLPVFPTGYLSEAFRALETSDVVLGPTLDCGYCLIGLERFIPELFTNIEWGTANVFERSRARLVQLGIEPVLLPEWFDIDTVDDLKRLKAMDFTGGAQTRTAEFLKRLSL